MKRLQRALRFYTLKFLRLRGTPFKVSIGFALGACINFYPTFGVGVILAGLLAGLFRVSIAASFLGDILFKSLFPVFFYFNLLVGNFVLGRKPHHLGLALKKLLSLGHVDFSELKYFGTAFFYGAVINTLLLGGVLGVVVYFLFTRHRAALARYVYRLKK